MLTFLFFLLSQILSMSQAVLPNGQYAGLRASWSYEGLTSPEHWATISPQFAGCNTSQTQSPINIQTNTAVQGEPIDLKSLVRINPFAMWKPKPVSNNVEFECTGVCGTLNLSSKIYTLKQFHFHSASEHQMNGKQYAFEIHLVHESSVDHQLAVVGILLEGVPFKNGAAGKYINIKNCLDAIRLPTEKVDELQFDLTPLLDGSKGVYRYIGGLTTPGCTDPLDLGVEWVVQGKAMKMPASQVYGYRSLIGPNPRGNFRPVQPLNGRTVMAHQQV